MTNDGDGALTRGGDSRALKGGGQQGNNRCCLVFPSLSQLTCFATFAGLRRPLLQTNGSVPVGMATTIRVIHYHAPLHLHECQ